MPIAAAVIGGVAAIGGALISSHAASNASQTAANTAAADNALQLQIYNSNKALETPFITSGDNAETELNGFLGLDGDPAASNAAFQKYLDSTGYQFNLNQGLDAATQSKAAGGELNSGATLKALDSYGTGLADEYGQQYVGNLEGEVGTGAGAANALAGEGENYANNANSNSNAAATIAANSGLAAAGQATSLIGQGVNAFGQYAGGTSYGGPVGGGSNPYNAFAPGG